MEPQLWPITAALPQWLAARDGGAASERLSKIRANKQAGWKKRITVSSSPLTCSRLTRGCGARAMDAPAAPFPPAHLLACAARAHAPDSWARLPGRPYAG